MNNSILTTCFFLCLLLGISSCAPEDNGCSTLACLNSGTCVNGSCACEEGYTGDNCEIQLTPVSMSIVGINITNYPTVRADSSSWDSLDNSGPDVFFALHEGTGSTYDPTIDLVSSTQNNATGATIEVDVAPPYLVTNLSSNWSLDVWDADGSGQEEFMGSLIFSPLTQSTGLPTSFQIQQPNLSATFFVQWDF